MKFSFANKKLLAAIITAIAAGLGFYFPDNVALIGTVTTLVLGALGLEGKNKAEGGLRIDLKADSMSWRDDARSKADRLEGK